jgi:hypothetical protein
MVAPLIAAAGISAVGSLFSGITGGKGASKAAKTAAQSAAADRAQALQIYNTNMGLAQPSLDRGNAAGAQINALLGLGGGAGAAQDALATFRNASGYQDTLSQGLNAVNTGYAARGALESGAAQKALAKYGANLASGTFGQYINTLQGQQAAGAGALGAATGAGNAYAAQSMTANNNASSAAANAALYGAQSQQQAIGGVANALGTYFGQSSYGRSSGGYQTPPYSPAPNALPYGMAAPNLYSGTFALNPFGR